jgi:hypothetical protein
MTVLLKQWSELPNAGDVFSAAIVEHLSGRPVQIVDEQPLPRPHLLAVGSILHWADACSTVWGSGFVDDRIAFHAPPAEVLAVRGPLTAARLAQLGAGAPLTLGDPGALAPVLFPRHAVEATVGIVPHYADAEHPWVGAMAAQGARVVDPLAPLAHYMDALSGCELIAASSLHGLVFAHAYEIPAVWVSLSDRVHGRGFKFRDYLASVGLNGQPVLDGASDMRALRAACRPAAQPLDTAALQDVLTHALFTTLDEWPSES